MERKESGGDRRTPKSKEAPGRAARAGRASAVTARSPASGRDGWQGRGGVGRGTFLVPQERAQPRGVLCLPLPPPPQEVLALAGQPSLVKAQQPVQPGLVAL